MVGVFVIAFASLHWREQMTALRKVHQVVVQELWAQTSCSTCLLPNQYSK